MQLHYLQIYKMLVKKKILIKKNVFQNDCWIQTLISPFDYKQDSRGGLVVRASALWSLPIANLCLKAVFEIMFLLEKIHLVVFTTLKTIYQIKRKILDLPF